MDPVCRLARINRMRHIKMRHENSADHTNSCRNPGHAGLFHSKFRNRVRRRSPGKALKHTAAAAKAHKQKWRNASTYILLHICIGGCAADISKSAHSVNPTKTAKSPVWGPRWNHFFLFPIFDFAGSGRDPQERRAMKSSADHTDSHRNPSRLGLFYGISSFLGVGAAGSGRDP